MADPTPETVKLLTIRDAAELLACSSRHLWRLIAAGELQTVRLGTGRTVRLRLSDLHRFVNGTGGVR